MKKIEWFIYMLAYCIYRFGYLMHLLFRKLHSANLFWKIPFYRKHYEKLGYTRDDLVDSDYLEPELTQFQLSVLSVSFELCSLSFSLIIGKILNLESDYRILLCFVAFLVPGAIITYHSVSKNKFPQYFKEFHKLDNETKRRYAIYTISFFIFVILLTYYSFSLFNFFNVFELDK